MSQGGQLINVIKDKNKNKNKKYLILILKLKSSVPEI